MIRPKTKLQMYLFKKINEIDEFLGHTYDILHQVMPYVEPKNKIQNFRAFDLVLMLFRVLCTYLSTGGKYSIYFRNKH